MGDSGTVTGRWSRKQYDAVIILSREPILITADHPGNRKWIDSIVELWPSVAHIIGQRLGWDES